MLGTADQLAMTTLHIRTDAGTGSGFILNVPIAEDMYAPLLVTNKHVIDGSSSCTLRFTNTTSVGEPDHGNFVDCKLDGLPDRFLRHPSDDVDLAALPIGPVLNHLENEGHKPFTISLPWDLIADQEYLERLDAVEDILMVGYPIGLWDQHNNLPIIRRGITATSPARSFDGKPQFMIDCACFPGSSGSPVFLYNAGSYRFKSEVDTLMAGTRLKLLGVLWGGPQFSASGEIVAVPVPTGTTVLSRIPSNLGFCIRADQLMPFAPLVMELLEKRGK